MVYDAAVVGCGLVGSAAAKYLSESMTVALIGPSEDDEEKLETFSCHADEGRITRGLDVDGVWAELARRSQERYAAIEEASGVKFHSAVGCLAVGVRRGPYLAAVRQEGLEDLDASQLLAMWPDLRLDATLFSLDNNEYGGLYERGMAGHVSPRKLLRAQLKLFRGTRISTVATKITKEGDYFRIDTPGESIQAKQVLVATNAMTNFSDLLPRKLSLKLTTQTAVRRRIVTSFAMPSLIVKAGDTPFGAQTSRLDACYVLPPILYEDDDEYYVKIGHGTYFERDLASKADVVNWYRGLTKDDAGASVALGAVLERLFRSEVLGDEVRVIRCVIPKTPTKRPYLHTFEPGLVCCVGCNGYAAKSSDELGRLAAGLLQGQTSFGPNIPDDAFTVVFDDD